MHVLSPTRSRYVVLVVGGDTPEGVAGPLASPETEVIRCPSSESAAAALESGRRFSAVVAARPDASLAAAAERAGVAMFAAGGAVDLARSSPVPIADLAPHLGPARPPAGSHRGGAVVAVCGTGGTGASVVAAALLARLSGPGRRPVLADLALRADQSFLHGFAEAHPSLLELVDAARYRPVGMGEVRGHALLTEHGYLLPGLRRCHHWTAVSPGAFDVVLAALRDTFDLVVADVTGDLEGERECGSVDIEERNHMARRATAAASVVVAVGGPGSNGTRRLVVLVDDLLDHGVDPARILPVVNRVATAEAPPRLCGLPAPAITIPALAGMEGRRLPPLAVAPLAARVSLALAAGPPPPAPEALVAVVPGSLGCRPW